jgi:hypothetical protein
MLLKKELVILLGVGIVSVVIFGPLWWQPVSPCVLGDMTARARAQLPDVVKEIYFDAKKIQFGLGSAAVGGWDGLGDAVVVGGTAWVRTTNPRSPNYYLTVSNRYFQSNGLVYIAPERTSALSWRVPPSLSLAQLWEALAKQNSDGVLFAGYVRLAPLRLIAIARAAIDGRPVLKNAPWYYTRPMESASEAWVYIAGIAAANAAIARPDRTWLSAMFTSDRIGPGAGLAHALWLKSAPGDFHAPPARDNVIAVGQLVADVTLMEGELKLYPITRSGECNAVAQAR